MIIPTTMEEKQTSELNGHEADRKIKGKSGPRKRTGSVATSPNGDKALFSQEIHSFSALCDKMAASRVDSSRRLCVRYKYYFLVAVIILSLQLFISCSFLSINQQDSLDTDRQIRTNDGKGPPSAHSRHPQFSSSNSDGDANDGDYHQQNGGGGGGRSPVASSHERRRSDGNGREPVLGISLPVKEVILTSRRPNNNGVLHQHTTGLGGQEFVPKCNLTIKETLTAIGRASSVQCKQEIADVGCRLQDGKLYQKRLPSYCPNKGTDEGVYYGCFRDTTKSRDLEGGVVDFVSDNSPQKCIDYCRRSGQKYAGLQFTKECWCGPRFGRHGPRLREDRCQSKCPGNATESCGAYLTNRIYGTGAKEIVRQPAPLDHPSLNGTVSPVKIVFILTVNGRAIRQVLRLIRVIYSPDHYYFIHVDKRQEFLYRELLPLQERLSNVMVTSQRFSSIWGGASLLQAHLSFLNQLFAEKADWLWDYYINLSESDYPIKPLSVLTEYLTAYKGVNFLKSHGGYTPRFIKKQGLDKTFYECDNHLWRVGPRALPAGIVMDGGSDWIGLHREFAKYVVSSQDELVTGLKDMYQYALLPVESFFHVVLQNSEFCGQSTDNNLHLTNWRRKQGCQCQYKHIVDWCGCSPNDLKIYDLDKLLNLEKKPLFFARKFEAVVDQEIINSLDITMFGYMHQAIPSLSHYWQNVYHHLDKTTKVKDSALTLYTSILRRAIHHLNQQNNTSCNLETVKVLEVNTFSQSDQFQGLLVMGSANIKATGSTMTLEVHSVPKRFFTDLDSLASRGRLRSLQVGTDFDLKERIFRNYGSLMGPYDDISLRHEWGSGTTFTVSVAWVDPTNLIAASYDIDIPQATHLHIGNQKPYVNRPLRPGVWSVKIMINLSLVAETQFLISPLTFNANKPASDSDVLTFHQGPPSGKYTSTDFSEFMPNLGLEDNPTLRVHAEINGRKTGDALNSWVDSLSTKFWFQHQTCILHGAGVCKHLPECNGTSWSSRSPDMKSDMKYIGSNLPVNRKR